jgi:cyclophilin family peptidyl-prolyl cis-trans isomerase
MHQLLHENYNDWVRLTPPEFEAWIRETASSVGLNEEQFISDQSSAETLARVREAFHAATALGISNIPTVFINGQLQPRAAMSYAGLQSTIGLIALGSRQYRECPPFEIDPSLQYIATIRTERGPIVIRLFADRAPLAVNSFVFLARRGWFDGTAFHRVIPGFAAQAGDPSGTGQGGPGYLFKNEIFTDLRFDKPGVVAMANSGPDTNGSQFFITYAPQPQLDGSYSIFGEVIEGMDVVESLTARDPQSGGVLSDGDKIETIEMQAQ